MKHLYLIDSESAHLPGGKDTLARRPVRTVNVFGQLWPPVQASRREARA
jgi:hypothetical protein